MRSKMTAGILLLLATQALAIRWMALLQTTSLATIDQADQCDGLPGLTRRQVRICRRNLEVMEAVRTGAQLALRECQWQFRARRWNCSMTPTSNETTQAGFGKEISDGTREAAFLHAVSSAGVAHSVTRACSGGALGRCGCDRTVRGLSPDGFQWSGCSDNVHYGTAFAKSFVDARDLRDARGRGGRSARALVNLHNNEVGRKVIEYNMRIECKCHGVSGSCETKTCWRALPPFRAVGALLRERFDGAAEARPDRRHHSATDLVFLESSPDFCEEPGTRGRPCNRTASPQEGAEGCDSLCCGRGFESRTERALERCDCKFHWCCFVRCRECEREVERNYCL